MPTMPMTTKSFTENRKRGINECLLYATGAGGPGRKNNKNGRAKAHIGEKGSVWVVPRPNGSFYVHIRKCTLQYSMVNTMRNKGVDVERTSLDVERPKRKYKGIFLPDKALFQDLFLDSAF